ncbi:DegT/DnrJ/EryC1/StrS family aminotransferase [Thiocystis violacea]|uniref:DegT/DnrJ/EryC1/StrS family aminotransferase n=1 Tax=Thiocystis violacea TaxID=13725 RepID=UPI00190574F3|nr:DegT/DnrJ/EryC1/StrS family aminotransferase [Thiocystis violacea]
MSVIRYYPQLATGDGFPKPSVPMLPPLSAAHWLGGKSGASSFLGEATNFTQGRYALLFALEALGVDAESAVLMPAYHCRSLVEPADLLGARVLFVPVNEDLTLRLDLAEGLVASSQFPVKAMVLPHYFGFPQPVVPIERFCQAHSISLIEDCAHAFFGRADGRLLGRIGRFSFASPRKFFPIEDGGILLDNAPVVGAAPRLHRQPLKTEIRALVHGAQSLLRRRPRRRPANPSSGPIMDGLAWPDHHDLDESTDTYDTGLKWLVPHRRRLASTWISRRILNGAALELIVVKRRQFYQRWLTGLSGMSGCRPLFPRLDHETVPYVFPLLIERNPDAVFRALKTQGVPLWRWEDMAVTDCAVSKRYRHGLLQLPCHQALEDDEIEWLTRAVKETLNAFQQGA